jgi:hypothetical protein
MVSTTFRGSRSPMRSAGGRYYGQSNEGYER